MGSVVTVEALAGLLPREARLIGLDLGTKTIGVAASDLGRSFAGARHTIRRGKFRDDAELLRKLVQEEAAAAVIVGLPLNMDGSEGPRAQSARAFVRNLLPLLPVPVVFWDERLSTVAAERTLIEADLSRAKRGAIIDAAAAAHILQGVLDRLRHLGG